MKRLESPCEKCGAENWMCVEYAWDDPNHYDGVSEIKCESCGTRWGRWSDKELKEGESEMRFGREVPK